MLAGIGAMPSRGGGYCHGLALRCPPNGTLALSGLAQGVAAVACPLVYRFPRAPIWPFFPSFSILSLFSDLIVHTLTVAISVY